MPFSVSDRLKRSIICASTFSYENKLSSTQTHRSLQKNLHNIGTPTRRLECTLRHEIAKAAQQIIFEKKSQLRLTT